MDYIKYIHYRLRASAGEPDENKQISVHFLGTFKQNKYVCVCRSVLDSTFD